MKRHLTVFHSKKKSKVNSWNWNCVEQSRKKKGETNVLYSASGYDTKQSALKQANSHNNKLIKKLEIKILI